MQYLYVCWYFCNNLLTKFTALKTSNFYPGGQIWELLFVQRLQEWIPGPKLVIHQGSCTAFFCLLQFLLLLPIAATNLGQVWPGTLGRSGAPDRPRHARACRATRPIALCSCCLPCCVLSPGVLSTFYWCIKFHLQNTYLSISKIKLLRISK